MYFDLLGPLRVSEAPPVGGSTRSPRPDHSPAPDPGNVSDLGGAKQQTVLAALLLARGALVSTDRLIELLWGDRPPSKPNVTLRSYISHLRRVLEPDRGAGDRARLLVTRSPGYALEIEPEALDIVRFEGLLDEARRALESDDLPRARQASTKALGLWRTDRLDEGPLRAFDAEVARLGELRLIALETQHEALLGLGRHVEAVPTLESLVVAEPLREQFRAQLMLALYRCGRQADALATFQEARNRLVDSHGLEPSPELRQLEARILADDPNLQWIAPASRASEVEESAAPPVGRSAPIGREAAAAQLAGVLDAGTGRSATAAAITGEPGIGKTTLLTHLGDLARIRGFAVVWARCHHGAEGSALRPWASLLDELTAELDPDELRSVTGDGAPFLGNLLPGIARRLDCPTETEADQFSLFDAMIRLLRRLSEREPIFIAFEDLHWSDAVSIRFLNYALPELTDSRVAIAATWRDTEAVADALQAGLAEFGRLAAPHRVALDGLSVADTQRLGTDSHIALDASTASSMVARTKGNPLFLTEILRAYAATSQIQSTDTIRDVLARRVAMLPTGTDRTLTVGALCTDGFTEDLLAAVTDCSVEEILDQLDAALSARLIEEDPDDPEAFRFAHALIADALTEPLSRPRRARYHTAIATSLESLGASAEKLAHHFLAGSGAESLAKGAEYAYRAAVESLRLWDHDAAGRLLEAGLAAIEGAPDEVGIRIDLLTELSMVRKHQGRAMDGQDVALEAFELALQAGQIDRMAIAALVFVGWARPDSGRQLDQWLGYWSPPGQAIRLLSTCLERMEDDHRLRLTVSTALFGQYFGEYADVERSTELAEEAIRLARHDPDPDAIVSVLHHAHYRFDRHWSLERRTATLDEILTTARHHGLLRREIDVRRARVVNALDHRDLSRARDEASMALHAAHSTREPVLVMKAEVSRIALELITASLADVDASLERAFERFAPLGLATLDQFGLQLATLRREQGRLDEVEMMLRLKLEGYPGPAFRAPLAMVLVEMGRIEEAREILETATRNDLTSGGEGVLQFTTPCFFAEATAYLGDAERATLLYDALLPAASRTIAMFDGMVTYGCGSLYLGRLARVLGRFDEAEAHLDDADRHHGAMGDRRYGLRTLLGRTELAAARGDEAQTLALLAEAEEVAVDVELSWLVANRVPVVRNLLAR